MWLAEFETDFQVCKLTSLAWEYRVSALKTVYRVDRQWSTAKGRLPRDWSITFLKLCIVKALAFSHVQYTTTPSLGSFAYSRRNLWASTLGKASTKVMPFPYLPYKSQTLYCRPTNLWSTSQS
jgi:hypothetical protein